MNYRIVYLPTPLPNLIPATELELNVIQLHILGLGHLFTFLFPDLTIKVSSQDTFSDLCLPKELVYCNCSFFSSTRCFLINNCSTAPDLIQTTGASPPDLPLALHASAEAILSLSPAQPCS